MWSAHWGFHFLHLMQRLRVWLCKCCRSTWVHRSKKGNLNFVSFFPVKVLYAILCMHMQAFYEFYRTVYFIRLEKKRDLKPFSPPAGWRKQSMTYSLFGCQSWTGARADMAEHWSWFSIAGFVYGMYEIWMNISLYLLKNRLPGPASILLLLVCCNGELVIKNVRNILLDEALAPSSPASYYPLGPTRSSTSCVTGIDGHLHLHPFAQFSFQAIRASGHHYI